MTDNDPTQLDDPVLKTALRRARGGHRAPPALRDQVMRQIAAARPPAPFPQRVPVRWGLAVAAAVLLAVGAGSVLLYRQHVERKERAEYTAANLDLFQAMARAHATPAEPAPIAPEREPESGCGHVAGQIQARLGRPVPSVDLYARGWELTVAGVTQLGATPVAHWRWTRNGQSISVFAVPAADVAGADDVGDYELMCQQHPLAGVIRDGHLLCVVGDPAVPFSVVQQIAAALRGR